MAGIVDLGSVLGLPLCVQGLPAVFNTHFGEGGGGPVRDFPSYALTDIARQRRFVKALQDEGIRVTSRGTWFVSAAHTGSDIEDALTRIEVALRRIDQVS